MLATAAGPEGVLLSGSEFDLPPARAFPLVHSGYAKALDSPAAEAATLEPRRETAALSVRKVRR